MSDEKIVELGKVIYDENEFCNPEMGPWKKTLTSRESIEFCHKVINTNFNILSKRINELEKRIDKHLKD